MSDGYPIRPTWDTVTVGDPALPLDPAGTGGGVVVTPPSGGGSDGYPMEPTWDTITATGGTVVVDPGTGTGGGGSVPPPAPTPAPAPAPVASGLIAIKPPVLVVPEEIREIYASSEQAGHPPRLLLRPSNPAQWWTANGSATTHRLIVRLNGAQRVDTIALLLTNALQATTIRVFGAATRAAAEAGSGFSIAARQFWASTAPQSLGRGAHAYVRLSSVQTYEWWVIEIAGAPNIFAASHLVLGEARVSARNYNGGAAEEPDDFSDVSYTADGAMASRPGFIMRRADFELVWISEAEYEQKWRTLWWEVGTSKPVLVLPNSADSPYLHDRLLYGRITRSRGIHETSKYFGRSLEVASLI